MNEDITLDGKLMQVDTEELQIQNQNLKVENARLQSQLNQSFSDQENLRNVI